MIDVVVPVYGQLPLVAQCISTLAGQKSIGKIFLVDDASPGSDIEQFASAVPVHYVRLQKNVGFVNAVNIGMGMVETEYAVMVNSDAAPIHRDSLRTLVMILHEQKQYVAGPKLLFMRGSKFGHGGSIQHAGIAFNPEGVPYHPFMHLHRETRAANVMRQVHAVTGAVMAVKMDVWKGVGGFSQEFAPGVYEDVDFCLKARKVMYTHLSEWWHVMHASQDDGHDLFKNEDKHLKKLLKRWGTKCDEELYYGI